MLKFEKSINQVILELKNWVLRKFRLGLNNQFNQTQLQDQLIGLNGISNNNYHHENPDVNQQQQMPANASIYSSYQNINFLSQTSFNNNPRIKENSSQPTTDKNITHQNMADPIKSGSEALAAN